MYIPTEFRLERNPLLKSVIARNACRYYVNDYVVTQVVHDFRVNWLSSIHDIPLYERTTLSMQLTFT